MNKLEEKLDDLVTEASDAGMSMDDIENIFAIVNGLILGLIIGLPTIYFLSGLTVIRF